MAAAPQTLFRSLLLVAGLLLGAQALAVDSDGDGVDDAVDAFPSDPCGTTDTDGDGKPNQLTCLAFYDNFDGTHIGPDWYTYGYVSSTSGYTGMGRSLTFGGTFGAGSGLSSIQINLTTPQELRFYYSGSYYCKRLTVNGVETSLSMSTGWVLYTRSLPIGNHEIKWSACTVGSWAFDEVTIGPATVLVMDIDDDNDGVIDTADVYALDNTRAGDIDRDGIEGLVDNCPANSNADQLNTDGDAQGNVCDTDDDNDGVDDSYDLFPLDNTRAGDYDSDGVEGLVDNCPGNTNANQLNTDGDAQGNVCDADDDNDGVDDASDKFPLNRAASSDSDNDGFPGSWNGSCDATCQAGSGLSLDNCPTFPNPTQANYDGDAQGDACDTDDDNDTVADGADNCPLVSNLDQLNTDGDAQGDACDTDDDNDGVADTADRYPLDATRYQNPRHSTDIDRDSDVLVRSASTGAWTRYSVENNVIVGNGAISAYTSSSVQYVAQLDANGDGDADILTRNTATGAWYLHQVQTGAVTSTAPIYLYASLDQQFIGAGDFNNDGTDDVMLRSVSAGYYTVFLLSNHAVNSTVFYNAWTAASSVPQVIGDFDGDGTDDLLVRRTSDNLYFIFKTINGGTSSNYCACNIWANTDWTFQFAGDTNKDGIDDIVIRGTGPTADGKWWAFRMNNFKSVLTTNLNLFINKTAVSVGAVGDYNGDGTVDVLTRVNNSTTYVSPIVNGAVTGNYWLYNFTADQVIGR